MLFSVYHRKRIKTWAIQQLSLVVILKSNCPFFFLLVEEFALQFFSVREVPTEPNTSGA
jgi:hypothetical protein